MKKILISVFSIAVVGAVAFGATQAFFSDKETSKGNILQAGALDLKIDNTCYYNGQACTEVKDQAGHPLGSFWNGEVRHGNECSCTWTKKDLDEEVFFDLRDLKPGDWEEDTISLHVDNPSWVCAKAKLTSNDDFSCTEPEKLEDLSCTDPSAPGNANAFDGELAQNLHFVFWYDDGDNVLEKDEKIIRQGEGHPILGASWPIADSETGNGPIPAGKDVFIGKAFCYGVLGLDPKDPGDHNSPVGPITNSGITCDGKAVNNASQTDIATGDVEFEAVQARHNEKFLCKPP